MSFGSSLVTLTIYTALQDCQCQISCTSPGNVSVTVVLSEPPSPLNPFRDQLIYWYSVLCKKFWTFLQHYISKTRFYFYPISLNNVHPSTPYWNTAQTIDLITLIFNADVISDIADKRQIDRSLIMGRFMSYQNVSESTQTIRHIVSYASLHQMWHLISFSQQWHHANVSGVVEYCYGCWNSIQNTVYTTKGLFNLFALYFSISRKR